MIKRDRSKLSKVPVHRQRQELYGSTFIEESLAQRADDIRRKLIIDYSVPPEQRLPGYEKRDTWKEEAEDIIRLTGGGLEIKVLDAGMSGGYMIRCLLEAQVDGQRFEGSIVGADIEAPHIRRMRQMLGIDYPSARIDLGKADAEKLDAIEINGAVHPIPDNFFDVTIENYIHHHTPNPEAAIDAALRVTKPGGYAFFAGRAPGHLDNVYFAAELAANSLSLTRAEPYYDHYDFFMMKDYLEQLQNQGKCRIIKEGVQVSYLWIDGTDEGWRDLSNAVMALLPDMNRGQDKSNRMSPEELRDFLDNLYFPGYFAGAIRSYNGYFIDYVAQKYFEVEVLE